MSEHSVSDMVGHFGRYFNAALSVGRDWMDGLADADPRRNDVLAMSTLIANCAQGLDRASAIGDLHRMMCRNCNSFHPALAALCRGKPIECCWLLKGYRCWISS